MHAIKSFTRLANVDILVDDFDYACHFIISFSLSATKNVFQSELTHAGFYDFSTSI